MDPVDNLIMSLYGSRPTKKDISEFEQLLAQFAAHETHEREFVEEYREIVDRIDSPLVKFLLRLILSDEQRHHDIVQSISSGLRKDLEWLNEGADMPKLGALSNEAKAELQRLTADFIKAEKETIGEFEALAKRSEGYRKGLLNLLVRVIVHDSEKHLMILEFIDGRLKEA